MSEICNDKASKEKLYKGLLDQAKIMKKNGKLMLSIYGKDSNANELVSAAELTEDWMEEIEKEINEIMEG